jgi:hypothetical protein
VALIVLPVGLIRRRVDDDRLHCGRANIQANQKFLHHLFLGYSRSLRDKKTGRRVCMTTRRASLLGSAFEATATRCVRMDRSA